MFRLQNMLLAAALLVGSLDTVSADAHLARFFGSYTGFGFAEDTKGPFINTERDFELSILPFDGDGFEISWSTVKRKGSDPNSLEATTSHQTSRFRPSGKPGIYHALENGAALGGDQLSWARLQGDLLTLYQFVIEEPGIPELHIYRRMLTPRGLELRFTASRDGELVRTVRGRYRRK